MEIFRKFSGGRAPSQVKNVPVQAKKILAKNSDISPVFQIETIYKSDSNIDAVPAILKIIAKTHKKHLRWKPFSVYSLRIYWKSPIAEKELY